MENDKMAKNTWLISSSKDVKEDLEGISFSGLSSESVNDKIKGLIKLYKSINTLAMMDRIKTGSLVSLIECIAALGVENHQVQNKSVVVIEEEESVEESVSEGTNSDSSNSPQDNKEEIDSCTVTESKESVSTDDGPSFICGIEEEDTSNDDSFSKKEQN